MTNKDYESDENLSRLYRQVSDEQSPADLDARVLELARAAHKQSRPGRWLAPLALAATITLAVGVALRVDNPINTQKLEQASESAKTAINTAAPSAEQQDEQDQDIELPAADTGLSELGSSAAILEAISEPERKNRLDAAAANRSELAKESKVIGQNAEELAEKASARQSFSVGREPETSLADADSPTRAAESAPLELEAGTAASGIVSPESLRKTDGKVRLRIGNAELQISARDSSPCAAHHSNPVHWQLCIKALRDAGETTAVERSIENWRRLYPELPAP